MVDVTLAPSAQYAAILEKDGHVVPTVHAPMMVDTGAQLTVVDVDIAEELQLPPLRFRSIVGVSQEAQECPVYRMRVILAMRLRRDDGPIVQVEFEADIVGAPSSKNGATHRGLIGRDFLANFTLIYNGPTGEFEISQKDAQAERPETKNAAKRDRQKRSGKR